MLRRVLSPTPPALKVAASSAAILTVLWLLSPARSERAPEAGVVEIHYMGPGGAISDAMDEAVKVFEEESREAHRRDPSKPAYRVVSGQTGMRSQTEDPTRFLLSVAGGEPPDVIYFDRFAIAEWAARDAFTDLSPFIERDHATGRPDAVRTGDYYEPTINEVTFTHPVTGEHGLYGIPDTLDSRALFYNKDLLKSAGYVDEHGEARPPRTWEELEAMTKRLTERDASGRLKRLGLLPSTGQKPYNLYLFGWMNGAEALSPDGRTITLNAPEWVEALDTMTRLYDLQGGMKEVIAFQRSFQTGDLEPFITGQVAMKIDGFWILPWNLAWYGQNLNYGAAPMPMPQSELAKGRRPVNWIGGWCYSIPSTAKHKEAAWEFIRFMTSPRARQIRAESQRQTFLSQGRVFVPDQFAHRAANEENFERFIYGDPAIDSELKAAVRVLNDVIPDARFRPATPVGNMLFNLTITANEQASYHDLSAKEALDRATAAAQRELNRVLDPPGGARVRWTPLVWAYGALVILAGAALYFWDTSARARRAVAGLFERLHLGFLLPEGGVIEGAGGGFFRQQWRGGLVCALPWLIGFLVFTGGPILFSIVISFAEYDILRPARFSGLANYARMLGDDELFGTAVYNTAFMIIGIPLGMALSLGIALLLNLKVRGIAVWRTFFYLPSIVPAVASSILWIWIFNPQNGLLNTLLASFGIDGPNWLQDKTTSKPALILMGLWGAGGGMIIWLAGLKGIAESYYEAARIDGASTWRQFRSITLPMLSPYILFNLIMGVIGTLQIFTQAFIMTNGGPVNSTLFYVYHLFNHAFRYLNMGYASALAWVLVSVVFALTVLQLRLSKRWVHYEGE